MQEGLYKVEFKTQRGIGYGCVVLAAGKVRGGDAGMFYVGNYTLSGDELTADLMVDRHSSVPGQVSVFGVDKVQVALRGTVQGDRISTKGTSPQAPGLTFEAVLSRLTD